MILIAALMISIPLFLGTPQVRAQDQPPGPDQPAQAPAPDQPQQGAGRVSFIHGDVSTMRGDSGEWVATIVNAPLVPGDSIATAQRSRAEVQLDYANILRLEQSSEAKLADLERGRIQIQVASGLVSLSVLKGTEAEVEIDTPNMAVHPRGEGTYRIQVNSPSDTQVTVRKGAADVSTQQGSTTVENGQVIYVKGTDNPEYRIDRAAASDEFDQWNRDRDRATEQAESYRYTNRYYTGANDLDQYGNWENVPDYGWCWTPAVDAGWVPYADGRWVWEPYWGWTWVSYEPWGWAPYHYGRWLWYGNSWCWWPGYVTPFYRPIWAPAYVSFFGFGRGRWGFGAGFGFGSIGWLPLGPLDMFHPWWGARNSYNVVNITNITTINNRRPMPVNRVIGSNLQGALSNVNIRRGITTVSAENFVQGQLPRNRTPVDVNTLRQASVVKGTLPVVPTRESLRPIDRPVNRAGLPRAGAEHFFTSRPAPAGPAPFAERAAQIQHMVQTQNPFVSQARDNREAGRVSAGEMNRQAAGGAQAGERGNFQRFGTPLGNSQASHPSSRTGNWPAAVNMPGSAAAGYSPSRVPPSQPNSEAGWRRFSTQPRPAGGSAERSGGWNAPAPRERMSYPTPSQGARGWGSAPGGGYQRPPLQLRKPIVTQRSNAPRSYGSGGGRGYSAPSSGGSRSAPAPRGGGGSRSRK
jgi:hypothetical protein